MNRFAPRGGIVAEAVMKSHLLCMNPFRSPEKTKSEKMKNDQIGL